ncbi:GntR family transcriptional regulator [Streptomyces sp. CA2R106]|uniref:GntR family transcriptional regulator n=1 Tax=Streptomyces sp. CA2R106 TaxID=3120153 RepID=UPI00300988AC
MTVSANDPRAPYLQVAEVLREEIKAGKYAGERLPSYRELEERFGVANMTARSALRVLREENVIYTVPGRGSFVTEPLRRQPGDRPAVYDSPGVQEFLHEQARLWKEAERHELEEPETQAVETEASLTDVLITIRDEMRAMNAELRELKAQVAELTESRAPHTAKRPPSKQTQAMREKLRNARDRSAQD